MNKFDLKQLNLYVQHSKFTCEKHPTEDLHIYSYHNGKIGHPIIWDNVNKHLRGLIVNSNGQVIHRSFSKFFTFKKYITSNKIQVTDGEVLRLPKCKFKILEKVDGSLGILYWSKGIPHIASQRSFCSPNALKGTEILHKKYSHLFKELRKDVSYIFEVIYPETSVMVNYNDAEELILLNTIDNITGNSLIIPNPGFLTPKQFTDEYGHIEDLDELVNLNIPNIEGFVLEYENGLRVKLKFPWFTKAKKTQSQILMNTRQIYKNKRRLSSLLGIKRNYFSNEIIWSCLKSGNSQDSLYSRVPEDFFSVGFDSWASKILNELHHSYNLMKLKKPELGNDAIWNLIRPKQLEVFDYDKRLDDPTFHTPMWNLLNRLKDTYL